MSINNIYNVIRVSDLREADALENIMFFGYEKGVPVEDQSVQVPYALIDERKQNKLVNLDDTIILTDLPDGTTEISAAPAGCITDVQEDAAGGTKVLEVTGQIVLVKSAAQVNYTGFESDCNTIRIINDSNLEIILSLGIASSGTNKILKDHKLDALILPKAASVALFKTAEGWRIIGLFGVSFFPDLAKDEEETIHVKPNGTGNTEGIADFIEIDETITADNQTRAMLEDRFPDAIPGFQLICPAADVIYIRISNIAGWVKHNITTL